MGHSFYSAGSITVARSDQEIVSEVVAMAKGARDERRDYGREPLFQPAVVETANGESINAFTRDISLRGVGLIHRAPIPKGPAHLRLQIPQQPRVSVEIVVEWCLPCGDDFFISGASFAYADK